MENINKTINIVCFGDSNTHGYNSKTGKRFSYDTRYTGQISKNLGEKYNIIEEGLSGRTTVFDDPLFEGLSGLSYIRPCLMSHEPIDLLIIMLGTNDTKERFSATAENIAQGMRRLITKSMQTKECWRNKENILLICPPPIGTKYSETPVSEIMGYGCDKKSSKLAKLYKEVADELGCHYLDAGKIENVEMYPYDHMHLSPKAHKNLANALTEIIKNMNL